jgi:hypothetical protein
MCNGKDFPAPSRSFLQFCLQHNLPQGRREVMRADGMEMKRYVLIFQELPSALFNTIFLREGGK